MDRPVRLLVNPRAGRGRALARLPAAEAALRELGVAYSVARTESLPHARLLAREGSAAGALVLTLGGDGLAGAAAGELRSTGSPLGVLRGGRGNDFARKLGIPDDVAAACRIAVSGAERAVDVADVGGRAFLGIASAGIDSDVQVVADGTRLPLGGLVYVYGVLRSIARWQPAAWTVTVDGVRHAFAGYSVAVANSGVFGGGMRLAPQARLDDGLLDVVLIADVPRRRYLATLPRVFRGTHVRRPGVRFLRGREVAFAADRPFDVYADGDPQAPLPVTIRVQPGVLRVRAPA